MNQTHTTRQAVAASLVGLAALVGGFALSTWANAAVGGPTVVLSSTASSTTTASSVPVTATFSEGVNAFSTSSIATTNATVSDLTGSSTVYTFTLTPIDASSTYSVMIPADIASSTASSTGNQASNTLTFTPAVATTTVPVISDVSAMATGTSTATISWTTDVAATSQVSFGTSTSYTASSTLDSTLTTSHSVMLSNLDEATLYHFSVQSGNSAGSASSTDMEFVTQSTASTTPLAIDSIDTTQSNGIADNTFQDGWQWVVHFTVPDNENAFRIRFSDWGNASSSFATANDVMIFSPESSNASSSATGITETDNGYSDWLYLTGDTATTTAGRQIDLTVEVKIPFGTSAGSYSSDFTAETYPSTATSTAI